MRGGGWEDRCRRHPEHHQSAGVCASCLRERLSLLSASSSAATTTTRASPSTSSTSSPYSAASDIPFPAPASSSTAAVLRLPARPSRTQRHRDVKFFSQPLNTAPGVSAGEGMRMVEKEAAPEDNRKGKEKEEDGDQQAPAPGEEKKKKMKKKIKRFLSRLVATPEQRRRLADGTIPGAGDLHHSKTMREKASSKWFFF